MSSTNHTFKPSNILWMFYVASFCSLMSRLHSYSYTDYQAVATSTKPLFRWIPDSVVINDWLSFICPLLMLLLVGVFPSLKKRWARVVWFVIVFSVEGFRLQYASGHGSHIYVWSSLFCALIPGDMGGGEDQEKKLKGYIRVIQLQIFLIYGLAGFWKLLSFGQSFFDSKIASGSNFIQYAMANEFLYSNRSSAAASWIAEQDFLCTCLSILVLVAQVGSLFVGFYPRFYFVWGLLLASFHVGTLITINVFFLWSLAPILIFLVLYPMAELPVWNLVFSIDQKNGESL